MIALDLIGAAGAALLRDRLSAIAPDENATARFLLMGLTGSQLASIVRTVLKDPIASDLDIAIPREFVAGEDLPDAVLTDERPVHLRTANWQKRAVLFANTDEDQGTSLGHVTVISATELTDKPEYWVDAASKGLSLPDELLIAWKAALRGLRASDDPSLVHTAQFVALTRDGLQSESLPLLAALGRALPALGLPRDSAYFALKPKDQDSPTKWKKLFDKLGSDIKPLLSKQRPTRQRIEADELRAAFENVREEIDPAAYDAIERFIAAPPAWNAEAKALAEFEWEKQGISLLFSGVKTTRTGLAQDTIAFFEYEKPDALSDANKAYLDQLKSRSLREARDDDREFFDEHREDLSASKALRAKWEKFVFGRAIESTDFVDGLLQTVERLFGQSQLKSGKRTLTIKSAKRTRKNWLELNADVGVAFALRYRGLKALFGKNVKWDVPHLFDYEELLANAAKSKKYNANTSVGRAARQIKFEVTLESVAGAQTETNKVQFIYTAQADAIGLELRGDLDRLIKYPFMRSEVARVPVSQKGALQSVSLSDVTTLQPAFGQDSGSLIPRLLNGENIEKTFTSAVKSTIEVGRLSKADADAIVSAWNTFAEHYKAALEAWSTGEISAAAFAQAAAYAHLLRTLAKHAPGDVEKGKLWQPVLALGSIAIRGRTPSAIVAPWHPLRLASIAVKYRSLAGLIDHLLTTSEVNFGDSRLFFSDLRVEFAHPYYPEVAVGYQGEEPALLTESTTLNDYSLMERPVREAGEAATDVDPREAANQIRDLVERYLELQPHERSNMSIMLYDCDAAGLPLAAVSALSSMQDEDEVHCNVLVRHRDRNRLGRVYSELLERSDADADAIVVSETSRNFMSKLRIGISLEGAANVGDQSERSVDIAFLHDVVSRQAREAWFPASTAATPPSLSDHVPARWSYRRVTAESELTSTSFLACPRQPDEGWAYLDAVAGVVERDAIEAGRHYLPARQISFQDQDLKAAFKEVHAMAEWVATYDDLLDKRQLAAQDVRVIRYRRQRTNGRNMVVSSTSELRILQVLVQQRLNDLSLKLTAEQIAALANRMVADAAAISGDIVLRAAKRGVSAGELIGLVLSRALVQEELGAGASIAWFLLDDYAAWLGQREEGLADILALSVIESETGALSVRAVVTEAKYVDASGLGEATRKSRQQLHQTVERVDNALFGDPGRMDRDLWLARIADLLLDGWTAVGKTGALERVRDGIRAGAVEIDLRGYSHVFVSGPSTDTTKDDQAPIADIAQGLQETFSRESLRRLILAYEAQSSLGAIRAQLGELSPWTQSNYRMPAPRVNWTSKGDDRGDGADPSPPTPPKPPTPPTSPPSGDAASSNDSTQLSPPVAPPPPPAVAPTAAQPSPAAPTKDAAKPVTYDENAFTNLVARRAQAAVSASAEDEAWLAATAQQLRTALMGYQLQAQILGQRLTPNAALVRLKGTDRLRVEDIEAKQSALLTTHRLRVIAITPLPGEIVVAIERPQRQKVSLWDLWARRQLNRNDAGLNTSFILGLRELDGEILYLNLNTPFAGGALHEPHSLVAGATGSGKSVLIQAILLDIAATNSSKLAHIYLIDPKAGVDYAPLERLPHIQGGVIIDRPAAVEAMVDLVTEMERRYALFRERGARDIKSFNLKASPHERLPMIFLIHDEFAEWMLDEDYKDAVTANVSRLGVKARAAGIHLIFAAQRPDNQVMPLQLRDNLGNRLILRVSSVGTSEIALGQKGAEHLLGLGHLAAKLSGEPAIVYAQAPFLSDEDIDRAVDAIIASD